MWDASDRASGVYLCRLTGAAVRRSNEDPKVFCDLLYSHTEQKNCANSPYATMVIRKTYARTYRPKVLTFIC